MRDPRRIEKYLKILEQVWEQYPDLRFTQLILNVFGNNPADYYIEDEDSIQLLINAYLKWYYLKLLYLKNQINIYLVFP